MMNKCKLCNSNNTKNYFKGIYSSIEYNYLICKNCETIYLLENLNDDFLKKFYSSDLYHSDSNHILNSYFKDRNFSYNNKLNTIFKNKNKDKNIKILDYGCGDGSFIEFLKTKGYNNIYGYEYDLSVRKSLEEKGIMISDLSNIEDEYFDIILCFDVIEHIKNPIDTFDMLYNKLKNKGNIIYTTGIYNKYFDIIDKGYCSWINYPEHLWVYSKKSFEFLNKNKKLKLIKTGVNGVFFNSNIRIILGQIKNIIFYYLSFKKKNKFEIGFPGMNGVYIYIKK